MLKLGVCVTLKRSSLREYSKLHVAPVLMFVSGFCIFGGLEPATPRSKASVYDIRVITVNLHQTITTGRQVYYGLT